MKLICVKMTTLLSTRFLKKTHNHANRLILFTMSGLKSNTSVLATLILLKIFSMTIVVSPNSDESSHTETKIQTPNKHTFTQSLSFFDPFFLPIVRLLRSLCSHIISFTDDTQSPSSKRLSCYSLHHVFSTVYIWLEEKQKLYTFPPIIKAKSFLYTHNKQIQLLYIDPNSHLI